MSEAAMETTRIDKKSTVIGAGMLVLGLVLAAVGKAMNTSDPDVLAHAYLFGWVYWACLTFGCLGLSLLHHAARGDWGFPILRIFESGGGWINLTVFGALFAPVALLWKPVFYPWARPAEVAADKVLQYKAAFFQVWEPRLILYFAIFITLALLNKNWQRMEDKTGEEKWWKKRQYFGGIFLVIFTFAINFLWTDILMSQYARWYSTIYGIWFLVGSCLLAFSVAAIIVCTQSDKKPYNEVAKPWLLRDLGNWMLTFTMLWAYFSLSQYLIIWSGNIEENIKFFLDRSERGWLYHAWSLIALHFFIPFTLLLSPRAKRVPKLLAGIGVYILFARFLDLWWVVTPTWKKEWGINPVDIGMFLVFGGIWFLLFGWQIKQAPLLTYKARPLTEAVDHV